MFKEQFSTNRVNPPHPYDLFNIKQGEWESLKEYLNIFCAVSIRLHTQDEEMEVVAFVQGMARNPFSESLIRNLAETLAEVWSKLPPTLKPRKPCSGIMAARIRSKPSTRRTTGIVMPGVEKHPSRKERIRGTSPMLPRTMNLR